MQKSAFRGLLAGDEFLVHVDGIQALQQGAVDLFSVAELLDDAMTESITGQDFVFGDTRPWDQAAEPGALVSRSGPTEA